MIKKLREPINTLTHLLGVVLSIIGFIVLLHKSITNGSVVQAVASSIFCFGLIGLYATSSLYHGLQGKHEYLEKWRKADHIMIYVLIAASYTPICVLILKGVVGTVLLSVIWSMAVLGIIAKAIWLNMPRKIYTALYVLLGWAAIFAIVPIYKSAGFYGMLLLVLGGISYTIGAVIYSMKLKFNIWNFGFHEVFHLFILLGSGFHFTMIYQYAF